MNIPFGRIPGGASKSVALRKLALAALVIAATCATSPAQLRITQYYEAGGSTNRWLELKNMGSSSLSLSGYTIGLWKDGNTEGYKSNVAPSVTASLSGTLTAGQVYLIKKSGATVPSYATADLTLGANSVVDFSGNDSVAIYTGTTFQTANIVDAIGFTSSGNQGGDISWGRLDAGQGWDTTAGSNPNTFPTIWARWPQTWVDGAGATSDRRLGVANPIGDPMPPIPGNWALTFQDEFTGTVMDGTKMRLGQHWSGMGGSGGVDPNNISVSGGKLLMETDQRTTYYGGATKSYATGEVSTFRKFKQKYGYFEARVKYPAVTGLWPAFWLMPDRGDYGWAGGYFKTYVKFDLTGVNPGTINTATLSMKTSAVETSPANCVVFQKLLDDSWTEAGINWNNAPVPDPKWIEQKWNTTTTGTDLTVDVKDYVAQQMAGDKVISFVLEDTFMRTAFVKFHSRENATQANRPRLVINGVTYYATEDAFVRGGTYASNNYGSSADLWVEEAWADTSSTWNGGMEVDIMESLGIWGPNETSHAMHWDGYGSGHQVVGFHDITFPGTGDGYHTYGLYWEDGLLAFYVDGQKTAQWENSRVMSVPAYMILSLQTGGWDNNNPGAQVNNQVMEIDYIRAWSGTRDPETYPTQVTIDNTDTSYVVLNGTWATSTATGGYYGSNYRHDENAGKGSKSAVYTPPLTSNGTYQVWARWTSGTNRASNVPIDIRKADGTTSTVTVNQQANNGQWMLLGTYSLAQSNAQVTIRNTGTNGYVIADGVRFTPQ